MKKRFTVILEREEEGGFHASCPTLPGCHSQGESFDEAIANIKEAISLYLESMAAHGEDIPDEAEIVIAAAEVETSAAPAASDT